MPEPYEIQLQVEGPAAMFARPDTGATPISYPVPTYSAAKGMLEAVLRRPHIYIHPTYVEVCKPIRYERYVTNYGGPLRKSKDITGGNSYQFIATILVDVCYRIYGEVRMKQMSTRGFGKKQIRRRKGKDWRPQFIEIFDSRLACGQTFYTPCLGWKEFIPTYFGPFRNRDNFGHEIGLSLVGEIHIPAMLNSMWDHGRYKPTFRERWIVDGIMSYENARPLKVVNDAK
ncbi:CRISPR-associated protein Cas5 [uncultured Desulfosarcina sp.]|uniref:CRISPR-associated protein Cas5 n=1 Tax=uncultured Desulfosarcina sp. TaxID=218289 RepID=UPI0029C675BE|nr:CRISPR-associated protein Cas5 [uncultured Desulfosarcina sp.]